MENVLTIAGERKAPADVKDEDYRRRERTFVHSASFTLPLRSTAVACRPLMRTVADDHAPAAGGSQAADDRDRRLRGRPESRVQSAGSWDVRAPGLDPAPLLPVWNPETGRCVELSMTGFLTLGGLLLAGFAFLSLMLAFVIVFFKALLWLVFLPLRLLFWVFGAMLALIGTAVGLAVALVAGWRSFWRRCCRS